MAGRFFLRFCLLLLSQHLPTPRYRRKRKTRRNCFGAEQEEDYFEPLRWHGTTAIKGEASSRPCMPQSECGAGHTGYRIFSDPSPGGSQDTGGAFRSRVQRHGVRHRSIGAEHIRPMWQRTDLAQVKRDRHTGRPRKARSTKAFRLRQSIISAEIRRKRLSLPTGEVRPSEHNYDYKELF